VTSGTDGTATIDNRDWLKFENEYSIDEMSTQFTVYKTVNGSTDLSEYADADPEFTFSLYKADYVGGKWEKGEQIAQEGVKKIDLNTHSVTFDPVTYGAKDLYDEDAGKYQEKLTKYYLIEENPLAQTTANKHFAAGSSSQILVKVDLYKTAGGMLQLNTSYATNFAAYDPEGTDTSMFSTEDTHHTINNTYTNNIALDLAGSVTLESDIRDMADQSFEVQVRDVTNAKDLEAYTVGGSGTADKTKKVDYASSSGLLKYTGNDVGKTFTYTVTQTKLTKDKDYEREGAKFGDSTGYTADTETYTITVKIGVDKDGNLTADYTVKGADDTQKGSGSFTSKDTGEKKIPNLDFVNKYAAKGTILLQENTTFRAVKGTNTSVQDWLTASTQGGFNYRVYRLNSEDDKDLIADKLIVSSMDAAGAYESDPVVNAADGAKEQRLTAATNLYQKNADQTSKGYTDEKSAPGVYYYYVEQVVPAGAKNDTLKGLTYGEDGARTIVHAYVVEATLTDDGGVGDTLKVSYKKKEVKQSLLPTSFSDVDGNLLTFTNTYKASGTVTLSGVKKLNNRDMEANEFTFQLTQTTAADVNSGVASELKDTTLNVENPKADAGKDSDPFTWKQTGKDYTDKYTAVGEYTYKAEETGTLPAGVTAVTGLDTFKVTVSDAHDGTLQTSVAAGNIQGEKASFENTYTTTGSITITGTKTINGIPVDGYDHNQFQFKLFGQADDKNFTVEIGTATSDATTGAIAFTPITYSQADLNDVSTGVYADTATRTYRLQEEGSSDTHYSTSKVIYDIEVTLEDNQKGTINAWISKITPGIKDKSMGIPVEYKNTPADQLAALASLTFNNLYKTKETTIISGKKLASGFTLTTGVDSTANKEFNYEHFAFLLYNCDKAGTVAQGAKPIDLVTLTDNAEFSFNKLEFCYTDGSGEDGDDTGDHYYKVVEVQTDGTYVTEKDPKGHMPSDYQTETLNYTAVPDMIYTGTEYVIEVKVAYNHVNGHLDITQSIVSPAGNAGNNKVEFTNTYPTGTFTIPVVSAYEAVPGTDTTYVESNVTYSYTMTPVDKDGKELTILPSGITENEQDLSQKAYDIASAPVNTGNINPASAKAAFAEQTVHNTEDRYYKIWQTETGDNPGMVYDEGYYVVKVTTSQDSANLTKLSSSISEVCYYGKDGALIRKQKPADPIRFTNVYQAKPLGLSVQVGKTTDNRAMKAEEFHFQLSKDDAETVIASNQAAGFSETAAVVFDRIEYTGTGTYVCTLTEKDEGLGGISSDASSYTVTIVVTDHNKGMLHGEITSIMKDKDPTNLLTAPIAIADQEDAVTVLTNYITFQNHYTAEGTSIALLGVKTIDGRSAGLFLNNQFNFDLFPAAYADGVYTASGEAVDTAVSDAKNGSFRLEAAFTQEDLFTEDADQNPVWNRTMEYHFLIQEQPADRTGYEANDASIGVTVTLTDNMDGTLKAEITRMQVQPENGRASVEAYEGSEGRFTFDNNYIAEGELIIPGRKVMNGADLATMKDGVFTFEIVDADGKTVGTAQNGTDGVFQFKLSCDGSMVGEETVFTIREVNDQKSGIKYDDAEYRLVVTVKDLGEGKLKAEGTLYKGIFKTDVAEFVNKRRSNKKHHNDSEEPTVPTASTPNGVSGPKTGDASGILGYSLLALFSSGGIFSALRKKKRRKKNDEK